MNAFGKDIWRTIRKEKKRLIALMTIAALGVTMMTGLKASCDDLRLSADAFFDEQNLHDLTILSTLGLTEEDVEALAGLDGVVMAQGVYSETVDLEIEEGYTSGVVSTFDPDGIDVPYLLEGRLPEAPQEIAVQKAYLKESGKQVGDTMTIREKLEDTKDDDAENSKSEKKDDDAEDSKAEEKEDSEGMEDLEEEEETPNFLYTTYTIVGSVTDVTSVVNPEGSTSFRNSGTDTFNCFVLPEAVDSDYYTSVNLTLTGAASIMSFSEEYEKLVEQMKDKLEDEIKEDRQEARYQALISEATDKLNKAEQTLKDAFAEADEEIADARKELDDGWKELEDGEKDLADGKKKLEKEKKTAFQKIEDGEAEIKKQRKTLKDGLAELDKAEAKLDKGEKTLKSQKKKLEASEKELKDGEKQLASGKKTLQAKEDSTMKQIADGFSQLKEKKTETTAQQSALDTQISMLQAGMGDAFPEKEWNALKQASSTAYQGVLAAGGTEFPGEQVSEETVALAQAFGPAWQQDYASLCIGAGQVAGSLAFIDGQISALEAQEKEAKTQFAAAWKEIKTQEATLKSGKKQLEEGKKKLAAGAQEIKDNRALIAKKRAEAKAGEKKLDEAEQTLKDARKTAEKKIADAEKKLKDGQKELKDGRKELKDGEKEYSDSVAEYQDKKAEAEEKLADAWKRVEDIDQCTWYIRDRTAMDGYNDIKSDADCIESIGTVFPILFLLVAVLISLTTINRMVDETRGLIGTYQALGFTNREIRRKYLVYATFASVAGGILGNLLGYIALPEFIIWIFKTMYDIPRYSLGYNAPFGVGGILLFLVAIVGSTLVTCRATLQENPAALLRPKAPKAGTRILLERITPVWKRMSFLNKVTARNLFRYKKRLLMTVFGIAGCTALLMCGFSIKDTVEDLLPRQYEHIISYDMLVATMGGEDNDELLTWLDTRRSEMESSLNLQVSSVSLQNEEGLSLSVQMYVIPDDMEMDAYISLFDTDKTPIALGNSGLYITENACNVLGVGTGSEVTIQDMSLDTASAPVAAVLEYYLGNSIFVRQSYYETMFEEYEPNAVLLNVTEACDEPGLVSDLKALDAVQNVTDVKELKDGFAKAFTLINMVVYVVIVLAGALAFVVLFTLCTTNISERERELATIKVLGFYDFEVHRYVNKETLILTGIGIVAGIPVGVLLSNFLGLVLNLPAINYSPTIYGRSYFFAVGMAFVFALLVDFMTNKYLNRIDPVEALKSIE